MITTIVVLTIVAMVAGFIDAIAGGGGLITLPALLLAGVNPVSAIATNKLQASAATLSATIAFARKGLINWKKGLPLAGMSFLGGLLGALLVGIIPEALLLVTVPILLILVATYFLFLPKFDDIDREPKISFFLFSLIVPLSLGFYDGIFGPGVGSFLLIAFIVLLGYKIIDAMSYTKLLNVSCNLGSLLIFISKGAVIFPIAIAMAVGAAIGANLGARFAVRFGKKVIKPLLIIISLIMAIKLIMNDKNPLFHLFF